MNVKGTKNSLLGHNYLLATQLTIRPNMRMLPMAHVSLGNLEEKMKSNVSPPSIALA
jgi:hypothetical protein